MKKLVAVLMATLVVAAVHASSSSMDVWELTRPLPEAINILPQSDDLNIVLHVNRTLNNSNISSDQVEINCNNEVFYCKAGHTCSCALPKGAQAVIGINAANFHNGAAGSITHFAH